MLHWNSILAGWPLAAAALQIRPGPRGPQPFWLTAGFFFTLALFFAFLLAFGMIVRAMRDRGAANRMPEPPAARPAAGGESAFASASVQAVIQRLREQERELERLHKEVKGRAAETERLSEAVTRQMPTGLLLVNATGMISLSNPAAEQTLGVGALQYRRYSEVLGAESRIVQLLETCLREGRTYQREEVEHRFGSGETRHLGLSISPVMRDGKKVAGALCLLSDLTEITALHRTVRLKESLATLGEMSAGIAHEFKNSLATISAYAQLVQEEAPATEVAVSAGKILQETRALTHVVTEFLRFARPLEVSPGSVALRPLVDRVVAESRDAHPRVEFQIAGEFPNVAGDEGLLRQALLNVVRNAAEAVCEFRKEGEVAGRVVVRGERVEGTGGRGGAEPASPRMESKQEGAQPPDVGQKDASAPARSGGRTGMLRVVVADNGPGISPDVLPKLFLPFFTTKPDGTGLGLAVVQKIAVHHGGSAEARNLPGGGAEFILTVPLEAAEDQAVA